VPRGALAAGWERSAVGVRSPGAPAPRPAHVPTTLAGIGPVLAKPRRPAASSGAVVGRIVR